MSKKLYGSLDNRLDEGHNFTGRDIQVGDDITMYYWSDRTCYYVTKVLNQKHIFVHKYEVCADHSKPGGMGHQNWLYFRTLRDKTEYLNSCHIKDLDGNEYPQEDLNTIVENPDEEWVFRYNKWKRMRVITKDTWLKCLDNARNDCKINADETHIVSLARYYLGIPDDDFNKVMNDKTVIKYYELQPISFGVREYYYDWEF